MPFNSKGIYFETIQIFLKIVQAHAAYLYVNNPITLKYAEKIILKYVFYAR